MYTFKVILNGSKEVATIRECFYSEIENTGEYYVIHRASSIEEAKEELFEELVETYPHLREMLWA